MKRVFACISLLVFASLGCAVRQPAGDTTQTVESTKESAPRQPIVVMPSTNEALPRFGDYVYVEELPEPITKVPPEYPSLAREAGVQGTVIVQALVGRDGRVKDTRIVKTIPILDAAATASVMQWVFKPALAKNRPVAVWVAVPVVFPPR